MPIKGLTDRQSIRPRLARLGKLRKGAVKPDRGPGEDLPYFRPDLNGDAQDAFIDAYGEKPKMVNAVLFYDKLEDNFSTWIECWDASGLVFRSDGEHWVIWREGDSYKRGQKPHKDHPDQTIVGRLEFLVPELVQQGFKGTVTLETHSNHDLRNIASVLAAAEQERGTLKWSQFILRRVQESIGVPGYGDRKGQRSRADKWLVKIEPPRQMFDAMLGAPTEVEVEALPAPEDQIGDWEEVEEVEQPAPPPRQKPTSLEACLEFTTPKGNTLGDLSLGQLDKLIKFLHGNVDNLSDQQRRLYGCAQVVREHKAAQSHSAPAEEQAPDGRPYNPGQLRNAIAQWTKPDFSYEEGQRGKKQWSVNQNLREILGGDQQRKQLLWYLTGKESSGDLTDGEVEALRGWLDVHKDDNGEWAPSDVAADEARAAWKAAVKELGQTEMFDGEDAPF